MRTFSSLDLATEHCKDRQRLRGNSYRCLCRVGDKREGGESTLFLHSDQTVRNKGYFFVGEHSRMAILTSGGADFNQLPSETWTHASQRSYHPLRNAKHWRQNHAIHLWSDAFGAPRVGRFTCPLFCLWKCSLWARVNQNPRRPPQPQAQVCWADNQICRQAYAARYLHLLKEQILWENDDPTPCQTSIFSIGPRFEEQRLVSTADKKICNTASNTNPVRHPSYAQRFLHRHGETDAPSSKYSFRCSE